MIERKVWKYKGKPSKCFIEDCQEFIENIFPGIAQAEINERVFFLGSLIKPKIMSKHNQGNTQAVKRIRGINEALKSFSIYKLDYLTTIPAFKPFLDYFMAKYSKILLKENATITQNLEDYKIAFEYLANHYLD